MIKFLLESFKISIIIVKKKIKVKEKDGEKTLKFLLLKR